MARTYRLFVPTTLDPKRSAPLLVALGGGTQSGDDMASFSNLDDQATTGKFIVVYPDGIGGFWNAGRCCGSYAGATGVDDLGFIRALLDRLTADPRIDRTRIFATGVSAGALMAYRLACDLSSRIAAIASVSGVMVAENCQPNRPVSILEMHGTADALIPYAGGKNPDPGDDVKVFLSTNAVIQSWVKLDGCPGKASQTAKGITTTSNWTACRAGTIVRLESVAGGHHTWFGSTMDPVAGEPSSNADLWEFFSTLPPRT